VVSSSEEVMLFLFFLVMLLVRVYQKRKGSSTESFENTNTTTTNASTFIDDIMSGLNQKLKVIAKEDAYSSSDPKLQWILGDTNTTPDENPELLQINNLFLSTLGNRLGYNFKLIYIQDATFESNTNNDRRITLRLSIFDPAKVFAAELQITIAKNHTQSPGLSWKLVTGNMYTTNKGTYTDAVIEGAGQETPFLFDTPSQQVKAKGKYFSSLEKQVLSQQHVDQVMANIKAKETVEPEYLCFGGLNPNAKTQLECEKNRGFWDTPVTSSFDCPFYKANKNYSDGSEIGIYSTSAQQRGGVKSESGYCDLPSGTQALGFRAIKPDPEYRPLCHNCIRSGTSSERYTGRCCDEQKNDPMRIYTNLASPDYAFPGDSVYRK